MDMSEYILKNPKIKNSKKRITIFTIHNDCVTEKMIDEFRKTIVESYNGDGVIVTNFPIEVKIVNVFDGSVIRIESKPKNNKFFTNLKKYLRIR